MLSFKAKGMGRQYVLRLNPAITVGSVGHDDNFIYAQVGDVISMENLLQKSDLGTARHNN